MEPYQLLEKELTEWSGMPYVVVCSSGTAALHLALEVMQFQDWSTVLVPDFTMIAVPRAVTLAGLKVRFVDCSSNLNLDSDRLCSIWDQDPGFVAGQVNAVIAVHTYGRQCNMEVISAFCADNGITLIEDLAEAHGVKPHPFTKVACYSFYRNKIVCGEEGGAVGFRDPKLATRARQLRSLGFTEDHDFVHVPRGHNYRLSNANASLILKNFESDVTVEDYRYIRLVCQRRQVESWYDDLCPDEWRMPPRDAPWVYDLRIPGMMPLRQTELVRALQAEGIAARHAFKPCHTQEEYRHCPVYGNGNAAAASREVIYLPLSPNQVTKESARRAFEVIRKVVG